MNFLNLVGWILIIYVVYYAFVILTDLFLKKQVNITTGVDDYAVLKPKDNPVMEDTEDYLPKAVNDESYEDNNESGSSGSVAEKKKSNDVIIQPGMIKTSDINTQFPIYGQQLTIEFLHDNFMSAQKGDSLMRQQINKLTF